MDREPPSVWHPGELPGPQQSVATVGHLLLVQTTDSRLDESDHCIKSPNLDQNLLPVVIIELPCYFNTKFIDLISLNKEIITQCILEKGIVNKLFIQISYKTIPYSFQVTLSKPVWLLWTFVLQCDLNLWTMFQYWTQVTNGWTLNLTNVWTLNLNLTNVWTLNLSLTDELKQCLNKELKPKQCLNKTWARCQSIEL